MIRRRIRLSEKGGDYHTNVPCLSRESTGQESDILVGNSTGERRDVRRKHLQEHATERSACGRWRLGTV
jgi:hypothetical protein